PFNEVLLHRAFAGNMLAALGGADLQDVLRIERALDERLAELDALPVFDEQRGALEHGVRLLLTAIVWREDDASALFRVLDRDASRRLRDWRGTLRGTRFEELLHTRQTLRDVVRRRRPTGV